MKRVSTGIVSKHENNIVIVLRESVNKIIKTSVLDRYRNDSYLIDTRGQVNVPKIYP